MTALIYVVDGSVSAGDVILQKGDALTAPESVLPRLRTSSQTTIVTFLVDMAAPATLSGWFSGFGEGYA